MPFPRFRQEKDTFEEEEADDLINFVENLDFDKFVDALIGLNGKAQIGSMPCLSKVGDLEFRQALGVEALVITSIDEATKPQLADLPRLSKIAREN